MKTLNDFKNENKDLNKLEMASAIGSRLAAPSHEEITIEKDSNWNCGDVRTCITTDLGNGSSITICGPERQV